MFQENKKIVDDVLLHDSNIETAFYHVFDYLMLFYNNVVTMVFRSVQQNSDSLYKTLNFFWL